MTLFYSSNNVDDFVLVEDLVEFSDMGSLNVNFVPSTSEEGWDNNYGKISKEMLKGSIPEPGQGVLNMICGSKSYRTQVEEVLKGMGYSSDEILTV